MKIGPYELNSIVTGDARDLAEAIPNNSVDLCFWSGPYFVGKEYEKSLTYQEWLNLLDSAVTQSARILKSGHFLVVNCADILAFADENLPPIRHNVTGRCLPISAKDIIPLSEQGLNKYQIAEILGVSEQTIDRRLNGNNARGRKKELQTRIEAVQPHIINIANQSGLYLYDRRIWAKDPAWLSCEWHTVSYRSIDEFEYILIFLKPGNVIIDRNRLTLAEWSNWGSRGVWYIPSVRRNDIHEAMFPVELATRVIRLYSDIGETVVDFFMGSGTTAVGAKITGRHFIGFEIDESTADLAQRRIEMTQPPLFVIQPEQTDPELLDANR